MRDGSYDVKMARYLTNVRCDVIGIIYLQLVQDVRKIAVCIDELSQDGLRISVHHEWM